MSNTEKDQTYINTQNESINDLVERNELLSIAGVIARMLVVQDVVLQEIKRLLTEANDTPPS